MFSFLIELISKGFLFFALHIKSSGSFPPALSAKEESLYFEKFKNGDLQAKNIIVEHNLRLVAHIIKKYYANYDEQEDLISIGTIGLIKAVNSFDNTKGIKFATYASKCIENEILMNFRTRKKISQEVSINEPIDTDSEGNPLTLMEIISVEDSVTDEIEKKIAINKIYSYIDEMEDEREKTIIIMRYGLYDTMPHTQREVASILKISRSYVSRIEKRVLENLKKLFE